MFNNTRKCSRKGSIQHMMAEHLTAGKTEGFFLLLLPQKESKNYSASQLRRETYLRGKTFLLSYPPFQRIFGTNDTSFESPYIGHLESEQKMGVASS